MRTKSLLLFVLAAGCGLVAMLGVMESVGKEDKPKEEKTVTVLVAKKHVRPKMPLTPELVEFKDFPMSAVPFGAVTKLEEYEGRALKSHAVANEIIMKAKLGEKGDFDPSTEIPPGMRVVSVPVNLTTSHSGMIRPTDRVDIFVTYSVETTRGMLKKTRMVLSDLEVFAIDSLTPSDDPKKSDILAKNVSLLVTPDQAAWVMMAQSRGDLHMALKGKDDPALEKLPSLTGREFDQDQADELFGMKDEEDQEETDTVDQNLEKIAALEAQLAQLETNLRTKIDTDLEKVREMASKPAVREQPVVEVVEPPKKEYFNVSIFAGHQETVQKFEVESEEADDKESPGIQETSAELPVPNPEIDPVGAAAR